MEERPQESHLRKEPSVPTAGKFHEVLSDKHYSRGRKSPLSRLEVNMPLECEVFIEKFDGNGSDHEALASHAGQKSAIRESDTRRTCGLDHLKLPSTEYDRAKSTLQGTHFSNSSDGRPRARGFSSSREGDETAEMWKRALRAESVPKLHRRSTSTQPVVPQVSRTGANANIQLPRAPCPSEFGTRSQFDSLTHSPTCTEIPTQDDEEAFWQSLVRSNTILEEWNRQLGEEELETTAKIHTQPSGSRSILKTSVTPPASWAKFPSHNRDVRNATAGELDSVKPRDFAVRQNSTADGISWTTDKDWNGVPSQKSIVQSVSDRFTQPFKSRWSKLVPRRVGTRVRDKSIRGARRSSIQPSGDLEYPELELLPTAGGYKELLALEREIDEMKGVIHPKIGSSSDESGAPGNRRSLVEQMAAGVLQHDGSSEVDEMKPSDLNGITKAEPGMVLKCLPATPVTQTGHSHSMHEKDLTDSSGRRYATPFSHFSLSRPVTPQTTSHLPATAAAHAPESCPGAASIIRPTSLYVRKKTLDSSQDINRSDSSSGRSSSRTQSAPLMNTSFDYVSMPTLGTEGLEEVS